MSDRTDNEAHYPAWNDTRCALNRAPRRAAAKSPCSASPREPMQSHAATPRRHESAMPRGPAGIVAVRDTLAALAGACLILAVTGCASDKAGDAPLYRVPSVVDPVSELPPVEVPR